MLAGPDKGKTGYLIGMENAVRADLGGQAKAIVKLETSSTLGVREIKVSGQSMARSQGTLLSCVPKKRGLCSGAPLLTV